MALFKDGEILDVKGDSPEAIDYREKKKWVKEHIGFPVVFKAHPSTIIPQLRGDGSVDSYFAPTILPNQAEVQTEDGRELWHWRSIVPRKRDGEYDFSKGKRTHFKKPIFELKEDEFDRVYFLMFKNPKFKNFFQVDDAKQEAAKNVESKIKEAKIYGIFYGENSVLLKDERKLKQIARAWNIPRVERLTRDQILSQLETAVREQDQMGIRSVDDFIQSTELDYDVEVGALIQKAEDLGVIKFDDKISCWFYVKPDKSYGDKLREIPKQEKQHKYEILKDYLFVEKEQIGKMKVIVEANTVSDEVRLDFNNLEDEDWEKVLAYCNLKGIASTGRGRTKKQVFEDILAYANGE